MPNPAARVKPPGVDDLRWREALQRCGGTENADGLWPVAARGFQDLVARKEAQVRVGEVGLSHDGDCTLCTPMTQDAAMAEHAARVTALLDTARALARKQVR